METGGGDVESYDSRAYECAELLYALGYLAVLGFAWAIKYSAVSEAIPDAQAHCSTYSSTCSIVKYLGGDIKERSDAIATFVYAFLVATNLRIILGSILCHHATSPLRRAVPAESRRAFPKLALLYALIKIIALASLWRAYVIGVYEPYLLPSALLLESLLIVIFDMTFFLEMRNVANYQMIIAMDIGAFVFSVIWLIFVIIEPSALDAGVSVYLLGGLGSMAFLFLLFCLMEVWGYVAEFCTTVLALKSAWSGRESKRAGGMNTE